MRESDKEKFRNKIFPYFLSWDLEALLFSSLHQKSDSQATPPLPFYFNVLLKLHASHGMQQMMPPSFTSICLLDLYGFPEAAILIGNCFFSPCYFNFPTENAQRWQNPKLTLRFCLPIPFIFAQKYFLQKQIVDYLHHYLFFQQEMTMMGPRQNTLHVPGCDAAFPSQMVSVEATNTAPTLRALAKRETLS